MDENISIAELENQDWDTLILKATHYVQKILGTVTIISGSSQFARGSEAKDIVFKAIELLFTNERKWNKNIHPELFQHLISTINSLLSNHFNSAENDRRVIINEIINEDDNETFWDKIISDSSQQNIIEYNEILDECFRIVEDDEILSELFLFIIEGNNREEIAEKMKKSIKEVDNLKKRLRRKLNKELSIKKVGIPK